MHQQPAPADVSNRGASHTSTTIDTTLKPNVREATEEDLQHVGEIVDMIEVPRVLGMGSHSGNAGEAHTAASSVLRKMLSGELNRGRYIIHLCNGDPGEPTLHYAVYEEPSSTAYSYRPPRPQAEMPALVGLG